MGVLSTGMHIIRFVSPSCALRIDFYRERLHEDPFQAIFGPLLGSTFSEEWVMITPPCDLKIDVKFEIEMIAL